jgi:hypothetical protein
LAAPSAIRHQSLLNRKLGFFSDNPPVLSPYRGPEMSIDLQDRSSAQQRDRVIRRRLSLWEPAAPTHPTLMALYHYWMSLCDTGLLPSPRNFRVVASAYATARLTGIDAADDGEFAADDEMAAQDYRAVRDIGIPLYHDIVAVIDGVVHSYARLILPFAADHRNVDRLIVCSVDREFTDLAKLLA